MPRSHDERPPSSPYIVGQLFSAELGGEVALPPSLQLQELPKAQPHPSRRLTRAATTGAGKLLTRVASKLSLSRSAKYVAGDDDRAWKLAFADAADSTGHIQLPVAADALEQVTGRRVSTERIEGLLISWSQDARQLGGETFLRLCSHLSDESAQSAEVEQLWQLVSQQRHAAAATEAAPTTDAAPRKPLTEAVKEWRSQNEGRTTRRSSDSCPAQDACTTRERSRSCALAIQNRFAANVKTFTFTYDEVETFFAGLEGLVGTPSSDFMTAMASEHASEKEFTAYNAEVERVTTPRKEWEYVTKGTVEPSIADPLFAGRDVVEAGLKQPDRTGWRLSDFARCEESIGKRAELLLPEVAAVRLCACAGLEAAEARVPDVCRGSSSAYADTGPMYKLYQDTLRFKVKGNYVTTLHAINSAILKCSRLTQTTETVYRGVSGGMLPDKFWTPNQHGVMGGIELGFMSTTTDRGTALKYMQQQGNDALQILFVIRMG